MYSEDVTIENELGLHARPAALFTRTATRFKSEVFVTKDGQQINGKSILGVMMLAAYQGTVLNIQAEGEDEREAVAALVELVKSKFGER
ncbi:MAG: HPr family phosphocarrier protein [Candidatus Eisenbacteria bacterium]|nr:HPr family phosphocarrier protein [Candidatus Eisenbacteria bacterium]